MGKVFIGIGINLAEAHGFTCLKDHIKEEQQLKKFSKEHILREFTDEFIKLEKLLGMNGDQLETERLAGRRRLLDMYE